MNAQKLSFYKENECIQNISWCKMIRDEEIFVDHVSYIESRPDQYSHLLYVRIYFLGFLIF